MEPTFETVSDALPKNFLGQTRIKYIHSVGAVAKCKFISNGNHPFTGTFKGADTAFCRGSAAAKPTSSAPLIPAMSLKFMRDGVRSADTVTAYGINGLPNGDFNFFSQDIRNHIGFPKGFVLKALDSHFAKATDYTQEVGLSNLADYDQDGNKIDAPVFPWEIRLHTHASIQGNIPTAV